MPLRAQAGSLWRPQVVLSASAGKASNETKPPERSFPHRAWYVQSNGGFQHLHQQRHDDAMGGQRETATVQSRRGARRANSSNSVQITDLQTSRCGTSAIVRTAERYFDAQLAQQKLQLLSAQLKSHPKLDREAQYRFDIGNRPITEVYESQTQLAEIQVGALRRVKAICKSNYNGCKDAIGHIPAVCPTQCNCANPTQIRAARGVANQSPAEQY